MEEKKLTDDTEIDVGMIVTALEKCLSTNGECTCINCKFYTGNGYEECIKNVSVSALALIHRLQAENERLTEENSIIKSNPPMIVGRSLGKTIRAKLLDYDRTKEQNAEMQRQLEALTDKLGKVLLGIKADEVLIAKGVEKAVKDTAKEIFTELKVKKQYEYVAYADDEYCVSQYEIEKLFKERYGVEVE